MPARSPPSQRSPRQLRLALVWAWVALTLLQLGVFVAGPSALRGGRGGVGARRGDVAISVRRERRPD